MDLLMRFSIKTKLKMILGIIILSYVVMAFLTINNLNTISNKFEDIRERAVAGKIYTLEINRDMNYVSRLGRNIMLGSNLKKDLLKLNKRIESITKNFDKLLETALSPEEKDLILKSKETTLAFVNYAKDLAIKLKNTDVKNRHLAYQIYKKEATPLAEEARKYFSQLTALKDKSFHQALEELHQYTKLAKETVLIGAPAFLFIISAFIFAIIVSISKPLNNFSTKFTTITSGDLTVDLKCRARDEIGSLARLFNGFLNKLKEIIKRVKTNAVSVTEQTEILLNEGSELINRNHQSVSHLSQIVDSMNYIKNATEKVKENVETTVKLTKKTEKQSDEGKEKVKASIESIKEIDKETAKLSQILNNLNSSSEKIGEIIHLINNLSEQTNLLALNAAIEAARAGVYGKGFAVVADEVRSLAEKTQEATKDIQEIIFSLQEESSNANESMQQTQKKVKLGAYNISETGKAFDEIVNAVKDINKASISIEEAVQEQSELVETITKNVEELNQEAHNNTTKISKVVDIIKSLQKDSKDLMERVSIFKV